MKRSFAILGLGRFGRKIAEVLYDEGAEIIVADKSEEEINKISGIASQAVICELSDPNAVKAIGLGSVDAVIIGMGENLDASIISTMVAKESGVSFVIAKAGSRRMGEILLKVGADQIIYPEEETAFRTAKQLVSESFLDYFDLEENLCIVKIRARKEWIGQTIADLRLRNRYHMNIVAIHEEEKMLSHVDPDRPLTASTTLLVVMEKKDLAKLK